ncbi:Protein of unknown function [Chitinophaga jiangningensis]|uniref:DUF2975 domain-containing protein n=1 Tax=Chitinophaga jiangningensis TaxID=1419482 RepID=A0A1M6YZZ8_9BACT|nr:DUF2975 domain-containing protein [Chitinophaga jiangningensis]SHL23828.1 Protein of unknown function [Chitinophaga jiangningensis]
MKIKHLITILKFMLILGFIIVGASLIFMLYNLFTGNTNSRYLTATSYEMQAFGLKEQPVKLYSADSSISYAQLNDHYKVTLEKNKTRNALPMLLSIFRLLTALAIMWIFLRILKELDLSRPFHPRIVRYAKIAAALFIFTDVLNLVEYNVVNSIVHKAVPVPYLSYLKEIGSSTITGVITFLLAVVYQRGVQLQSDQDLTI